MGKVEKEYRSILEFYEKRINRMARFTPASGSKISGDAILLDPAGRSVTSDEFYDMIRKASVNGRELHFVVGPPEGFGAEKSKYDRISLSSLTMRHELAYLVLLEQIYRALLRMKGTDYSK